MIPPSAEEVSDENIIRELINFAQQQQDYIKTITQVIQITNENIGFTHENKSLYSLQNTAINILVIINSSGLGSDNIDWTAQLDRNENRQALYKEVEDSRLMQGEIVYQLQSYQKAASVFINQNSNNEANEHLTKVLDIFVKNAAPLEPNCLKEYWQRLAS